MNNITNKTTTNKKYKFAKEAIRTMNSLVRKNTNPSRIVTDVYLFEDVMNGLSGDILGFEKEQYEEIVVECTALVEEAAKKNITISLYEKLLTPKPKSSRSNIEIRTAKKLYPLTTSVQVSSGEVIDGRSGNENYSDGQTSLGARIPSSTIPPSEKRIKELMANTLEKVKNTAGLLGLAAESGTDTALVNQKINAAVSKELLTGGELSRVFLADLAEYAKTGIKDGLRQIENISDEELNNLVSALNGNGIVDFSGSGNGAVGTIGITTLSISGAVAAPTTATVGAAAETGDDFDPNFDLLDAQTEEEATNYEQTPLVLLEDESTDYKPLIPEDLRDSVEAVATNAGGLQEGLAQFFSNPLDEAITRTRNLLLQYTDNNFQGLNAAVGGSATGIAYGIYQDALGGGDGLGGAVSQLDAFKDHTDRLSGLVLEASSENAEPSSDNTVEDKFYYDVPVSTKTAILSFNAKKFRSAKYYVQSTAALGTSLSANTEHQSTELFVLHDNRKVYFREVFTNYTIDPFSTFTAELLDGNVVVSVTSTLANTNYVIHGIKLRVAANNDSYETMSLKKILRTHYELDLYYDEDAEYASEMAGSLFRGDLVENLFETVRNTVKSVSGGGNAANEAIKVKTMTAALQASIDADYAAYKKYTKIAETLNIVDEVQQFYLVPTTKPILDLVLNNTIKSNLETEIDVYIDPPEEPDIELNLDDDLEDDEAEE